jgi:predicted molibdopterin-dependent oxidoreductase YjgC
LIIDNWGKKMRIEKHPILGEPEARKTVKFTHDGEELTGFEGEPVASALKAAGIVIHRYTKKYSAPRGIFCAIGRCTDCVMVVDGKPNVRTCVTPLRDGMTVDTQHGAGGEAAK